MIFIKILKTIVNCHLCYFLVNENDDISGSQDLISEKNAAIVMDDRKAIGIITPIDILNYLSGERSK